MARVFWLACLDVVLTVVHLAIIVGVMGLWAFRRTRSLHLWLVAGVVGSWFGLGLRYGIGYCPLTDWHWQIKRALAERELPGSFIQYVVEWVAGRQLPKSWIDATALGVLLAAVMLSLWTNFGRRC